MLGLLVVWKRLSLGLKLSLSTFLAIVLFFALMMGMVSFYIGHSIEAYSEAEVSHGAATVAGLLTSADANLRERTAKLADVFTENLQRPLTLSPDGGLMQNGVPINGNFSDVDRFTHDTGAVATIFARRGDDFIRVTTSLTKQNGTRAMGTLLDRTSPAYPLMLRGERYIGFATLFGRNYMTSYTPVRDANGQVIGITFVGLDFTTYLTSLKQAIRSLKIGTTGYYYVIDDTASPDRGTLVVSPNPGQEGRNVLATHDDRGMKVVQTLLNQHEGVLHYCGAWRSDDGTSSQPQAGSASMDLRLIGYTSFPSWHWVVVADLDEDEYRATVRHIVVKLYIIGVVAILLLNLAIYVMMRYRVARPLQAVQNVAERLAHGDLSARLDTDRLDEVGRMIASINHIGEGLTTVVRTVRANAEEVAQASSSIAQGNLDLSSRTEQQASAIEETSAAMSEMGSTVGRNAEHAQQASALALEASAIAQRGGGEVGQVVERMTQIHSAAKKIAEIIGMIDGIAFQTNILALNAGIEAARAGHHGRGFAVVASEVGVLSQRTAESARSIKRLIGTAVKEIDAGAEQAHRAGATMARVVSSIHDVTDLVQGISTASQEQLAGVVQIESSVQHMDHAIQQNATLVEDMAQSAETLAAQAEELVAAVAVFQGVD